MEFIINGKLPGRNDEINANRQHWSIGMRLKREADEQVIVAIMQSRSKNSVRSFSGPVDVTIDWFDNSKRDPDNIESGDKYIMDALVKAGVIPDDDKKHVKSITHVLHDVSTNPKIVVRIEDHEKE